MKASAHETNYADKIHTNSLGFIEFCQAIASEYALKYKLNTKIYPYMQIGVQMTEAEVTTENFIRISTKPAAKDRAKYKSISELPLIEGQSRYPYWENVRKKNIVFFMENVSLLVPEIDMSKLDNWKSIFPDLQYFTNDNMGNETLLLLKLFKDKVLSPEDIKELWDFLHVFIEHSLKYIYHRRKREKGYLKDLDIEREAKLFNFKLNEIT